MAASDAQSGWCQEPPTNAQTRSGRTPAAAAAAIQRCPERSLEGATAACQAASPTRRGSGRGQSHRPLRKDYFRGIGIRKMPVVE